MDQDKKRADDKRKQAEILKDEKIKQNLEDKKKANEQAIDDIQKKVKEEQRLLEEHSSSIRA